MGLSAGTKLGPYEILASIGAGAMGEVYRARDTRLGREVAIKILPDGVASDPRALGRFESESRAVAALSHPNILALFDVGESGGTHYAVAELLQGQTLRLALAEGPLPVRLALDIASQVADALDAAHENGIVHRDVKPENVFLGRAGRVKLLDFGLARHDAFGNDPAAADPANPTMPSRPETVAGTVSYMSPEQARGGPVDFRTDQFSLGIVLYEMLSGARPFDRRSAAETMAAIIREEAEPLDLRAPQVPAAVRWLVERLLEKEPDDRYAATRDLVHELASLRAHLSRATPTGEVGVAARRPRRARLALAALAGLSLALAAAAFGLLLAREREKPWPATGRFEILLPEGTFLVPYWNALDLSPDGRLLAFSAFAWKKPYEVQAEPQLFLRSLDSLESRPIPGTEGGFQPLFSPDGRHLAFAVLSEKGGLLRRVPVGGGPVQTICACDARFGAAWSPDGSIVFASQTGPLHRVPAAGGTPEPATELDTAAGELSHRLPHLGPDGRTLLYTALRWRYVGGGTWKRARIFAGRPGEKERTLLVDGGSDGRWAPPGNLLFARDGNLLAALLDAKVRTVRGAAIPLLEGVRHSINTGLNLHESGVVQVAASAQGLIAWAPGSVNPMLARQKVWLDASGKETPLEGGPLEGPVSVGRVSADGKRILLNYNYPFVQAEIVDLATRSRRRATFDVLPSWPIWGPGPDRITFASDHEGPWGLYCRRLDGGPEEIERLWMPGNVSYLAPGSWSPDGKTLAVTRLALPDQNDIWLLEKGKEPRPFIANRFEERWPDISPDGRWLLYASNAPGRFEVFVTALSGGGSKLNVSAGEGLEPLWSRDGGAIYYWQPVEGRRGFAALFRVPVTRRGASLAPGVPQRLFERHFTPAFPGHTWDVAPDGRFLVRKDLDDSVRRSLWDRILSNRIVVDTGGIARLLSEAKAGH